MISAQIIYPAETRGYDAGKCVKGRKRHILVDTLGLLLIARTLEASIQERDGTKGYFQKSKSGCCVSS